MSTRTEIYTSATEHPNLSRNFLRSITNMYGIHSYQRDVGELRRTSGYN